MHRLFTPEGGDADPRFRIGLSPIPATRWFEGGEADPASRKDALLAAHPALVHGAVAGCEPAQAEAAGLVADWLRTHGESADLDLQDLWSASRRVSDDLCLMERRGDGATGEGEATGDPAAWRLTAASLCAPTFFSAHEVVGLGLDAIHAPVPSFAADFARRVARIFDALRPGLVLQRLNWTVVASADLFLPRAGPGPAAPGDAETPGAAAGAVLTVRRERQTIRRLPRTGGVLFTIRVWREPLAEVLDDATRRDAFAAAWARLQSDEGAAFRAYKGLDRLDAPVRALLARHRTAPPLEHGIDGACETFGMVVRRTAARAGTGVREMLTTIIAMAAAVQATPPDLAAAAAAWDRAQVQGDRAAIDRLLASDYTLVNGGGKLEDKARFLADLTDPQFHLEPFTVEAPIVRVWPDGAVMGGVVEEKGRDHGKAFDARIRFADVWARRGGRWRLVYTHVSKP